MVRNETEQVSRGLAIQDLRDQVKKLLARLIQQLSRIEVVDENLVAKNSEAGTGSH